MFGAKTFFFAPFNSTTLTVSVLALPLIVVMCGVIFLHPTPLTNDHTASIDELHSTSVTDII